MIYSEDRGCIVDYLGTHQHLAVDIDVSVAPNGGLRLHSGEQRFYEGAIAFRFPLFFSGVAEVCEWFDDAQQCFRIQVSASNRTWGDLFWVLRKLQGGLEIYALGDHPKAAIGYHFKTGHREAA